MKPWDHYREAQNHVQEAKNIAAHALGDEPDLDELEVAELMSGNLVLSVAHGLLAIAGQQALLNMEAMKPAEMLAWKSVLSDDDEEDEANA